MANFFKTFSQRETYNLTDFLVAVEKTLEEEMEDRRKLQTADHLKTTVQKMES